MTIFTVENVETVRQHKLFAIMGTDIVATPYAWLSPLLMVGVGIVMAFFVAPVQSLWATIVVGVGYGLLLLLSMIIHGVGHIISSRLVHAPMTSLFLTATVDVTHYEDDTEQPSRVHVGRAIGGPAVNLLLGVIVLALYLVGLRSHFLLFLGMVNLLFFVMTLFPIPTLDGAVILHELRNWKDDPVAR